MKGVIVLCLKEMITNNYEKEKWEKILDSVGLSKDMLILPITEVEDSTVMKVLEATGKELGLSLQQLADVFGDYWVNKYSQKIYYIFYRAKSAKEFLLNMDSLHIRMTKELDNANPPRFTFDWKDDKTLIMNYNSKRGLIDFVVGLAKGVGKYYNEPLSVSKVDDQRVQVVFQ